MRIILDTANLEDIRYFNAYYPIEGVTTNPTILSREGGDVLSLLREIRTVIGPDKEFHVQVIETEYERILDGEIADTVRDTLRDALKSELVTRFGVKNCEVGLSLVRVQGELRVSRAVITLMGADIFKDPYVIENYFSDLLGCQCVVVVG